MKSFKKRIEYNSKKEKKSSTFTKGEVLIIGKEKVSKWVDIWFQIETKFYNERRKLNLKNAEKEKTQPVKITTTNPVTSNPKVWFSWCTFGIICNCLTKFKSFGLKKSSQVIISKLGFAIFVGRIIILFCCINKITFSKQIEIHRTSQRTHISQRNMRNQFKVFKLQNPTNPRIFTYCQCWPMIKVEFKSILIDFALFCHQCFSIYVQLVTINYVHILFRLYFLKHNGVKSFLK